MKNHKYRSEQWRSRQRKMRVDKQKRVRKENCKPRPNLRKIIQYMLHMQSTLRRHNEMIILLKEKEEQHQSDNKRVLLLQHKVHELEKFICKWFSPASTKINSPQFSVDLTNLPIDNLSTTVQKPQQDIDVQLLPRNVRLKEEQNLKFIVESPAELMQPPEVDPTSSSIVRLRQNDLEYIFEEQQNALQQHDKKEQIAHFQTYFDIGKEEFHQATTVSPVNLKEFSNATNDESFHDLQMAKNVKIHFASGKRTLDCNSNEFQANYIYSQCDVQEKTPSKPFYEPRLTLVEALRQTEADEATTHPTALIGDNGTLPFGCPSIDDNNLNKLKNIPTFPNSIGYDISCNDYSDVDSTVSTVIGERGIDSEIIKSVNQSVGDIGNVNEEASKTLGVLNGEVTGSRNNNVNNTTSDKESEALDHNTNAEIIPPTEASTSADNFLHLSNNENNESSSNLENVRAVKVGSKWKCTYPGCVSQFSTRSGVNKHHKSHINKYTCELCQSKYISTSFYSQHMRVVHGKVLLIECNLAGCNEMFENEALMLSHSKEKHSDMILLCPKCPYKSKTKASLLKHIKNEHESVGKSKDADPPSNVTSVESRKRKVDEIREKTNQRAGERGLVKRTSIHCEFCGKRFSTFPNLIFHKKTHIAGKKKKTASPINSAERIAESVTGPPHSKRRKYQADDNSVSNQEHNTPPALVRFTCTYCDKEFLQKELLNFHVMRIHNTSLRLL